MAKTDPIRNIEQIRKMEDYYINKNQIRNYVLFVTGTYTTLRISDLLALKWGDVYDFNSGKIHSHLEVEEKKTHKTKKIALNKRVVKALLFYLSALPHCTADTLLFPNNRKKGTKHICRQQAYKIIRSAALAVGIPGCISCHSMRKVIGYHSWKAGVPLPLISEMYNHASEKVTKSYLGISQDEIDEVYLKME